MWKQFIRWVCRSVKYMQTNTTVWCCACPTQKLSIFSTNGYLLNSIDWGNAIVTSTYQFFRWLDCFPWLGSLSIACCRTTYLGQMKNARTLTHCSIINSIYSLTLIERFISDKILPNVMANDFLWKIFLCAFTCMGII